MHLDGRCPKLLKHCMCGISGCSERAETGRVQLSLCTAKVNLPYWFMDIFEREHIGLELGVLSNKPFVARLGERAGHAAGDVLVPVGHKEANTPLNIKDKGLPSCCENTISMC